MEREQAERIVDSILFDLDNRWEILYVPEGETVLLEMRESLIQIAMTPPPPLGDGTSTPPRGRRPWWVQRALGNQRCRNTR